MFKYFTEWLDEYLRDHEPSVVLKAAVGLLAFASLLGAFFGSQALRAGAFVVVVFCMLSGVLLLLADRRDIRRQRDTYLHRLDWYYKVLSELSPEPLIAVENWDQRVEVEPNGDVREVLTLEAVAPREHVFFARLTARSLWDQPKRQLNGIRMTVRGIKPDGSRGPTWPLHSSWKGDTLVSYLDLDPPLHRGQVIRFEMERTWPAKCLPLVRHHQPENFRLRTTNALEIRHAEYQVVLPRGREAVYELVGADEPDVQLTAEETLENNRRVYKWRADKVPTKTAVGIRLQLR